MNKYWKYTVSSVRLVLAVAMAYVVNFHIIYVKSSLKVLVV